MENRDNFSIILQNHSSIIDYPIDYNIYPLAKSCKFYEYELNTNEFLYIPPNWLHWVFTQPNNFSMNYLFNSHEMLPGCEKNLLCKAIIDAKPYKGKAYNPPAFDYESFIHKNLNNIFRIIISSTNDCSPVIKPYHNRNILATKMLLNKFILNKKNKFAYISEYDCNEKKFNDLPNFEGFHPLIKVNYIPKLWLNFDNEIQSGLHYDKKPNILYNIYGKKKILLSEPSSKDYLYIKPMQRLNVE